MDDGFLPALAQHLSTNGLGSFGASTSTGPCGIVYRSMVESTGVLLALYEGPGAPPVRTFGDAGQPSIERARLQVLVRSTAPTGGADVPLSSAAMGVARQAYLVLDGVVNTTIAGSTFQRVEPVQPPYQLQRDEQGRIIFAANYDVWWSPPAAT